MYHALKDYFSVFPAFLHTSPPFSELPCLLEVDTFHMLVNLHFTFSSLFAAVTCPHGPSGPNGRNPVLPALIGITDHHLVRITAAAHVLQYLITCPPCPQAMEVDARKHTIQKFNCSHNHDHFFICVAYLKMSYIMFVSASKSGSGVEFGTGIGLQQLWIRYRSLARYKMRLTDFAVFITFISVVHDVEEVYTCT